MMQVIFLLTISVYSSFQGAHCGSIILTNQNKTDLSTTTPCYTADCDSSAHTILGSESRVAEEDVSNRKSRHVDSSPVSKAETVPPLATHDDEETGNSDEVANSNEENVEENGDDWPAEIKAVGDQVDTFFLSVGKDKRNKGRHQKRQRPISSSPKNVKKSESRNNDKEPSHAYERYAVVDRSNENDEYDVEKDQQAAAQQQQRSEGRRSRPRPRPRPRNGNGQSTYERDAERAGQYFENYMRAFDEDRIFDLNHRDHY